LLPISLQGIENINVYKGYSSIIITKSACFSPEYFGMFFDLKTDFNGHIISLGSYDSCSSDLFSSDTCVDSFWQFVARFIFLSDGLHF